MHSIYDTNSLTSGSTTSINPNAAAAKPPTSSFCNRNIVVRDVNEDTVLKTKVAEIATLQWPMIFGEACILDPESGSSRGTITADTLCDVFVLHKTQIQTFPVDDRFLEKVKCK